MKSFLLSVATALALSTPALSVAVWGQCGVRHLRLDFRNMILMNSIARVLATLGVQLATREAPARNRMTVRAMNHDHHLTTNANHRNYADYSQCLPGAATSSTPSTTTKPTTTSSAPSPSGSSVCSGSRTKFQFFGVNESGAEFGNTVIPGALGTDYTWPSPSSIDVSSHSHNQICCPDFSLFFHG
jgi:endoglucanase